MDEVDEVNEADDANIADEVDEEDEVDEVDEVDQVDKIDVICEINDVDEVIATDGGKYEHIIKTVDQLWWELLLHSIHNLFRRIGPSLRTRPEVYIFLGGLKQRGGTQI